MSSTVEELGVADATIDDPPPEEPEAEVAGLEPPGADVVDGWSMLTELPADATIDAERYRFETDGLGRIVHAEGDLHLSPGVRQAADAATVRAMMTPGVRDQAGHLIGNRFEGPGDNWNMVLQDANLNVSEWKVLENSWAKALGEGSSVQVEIGLSYHERDVRPYAFNVSYTVDGGEAVHQDILNAPKAASDLERSSDHGPDGQAYDLVPGH